METIGGSEVKCPVCGKRFFYRVGWVYKRGYKGEPKYLCSYHCTQKWDKEREETKRRYRSRWE